MSPVQWRTLERIAAAGFALPVGDRNSPDSVHPETAAALERRGLVVLAVDPTSDPTTALAILTPDGVQLATVDNPRHPSRTDDG